MKPNSTWGRGIVIGNNWRCNGCSTINHGNETHCKKCCKIREVKR